MPLPYPNTNDKLYAALLTAFLIGLLFLLCILVGLKIPCPLPEEQGVEVQLGDTQNASGRFSTQEPNDVRPSHQPVPVPPQVTPINPVSTQSTEQSVAISPNNPQRTKPKPTTTQVVPPENLPEPEPQPNLNPRAVYTPKRNTAGQDGGDGNTTGVGTQGSANGDPNSTVPQGSPGAGGVSFNLSGRSSKNLVKPSYKSVDQGTIVVKIWVDRSGNVVKAQAGERGTTITDHSLFELTEKAALQSSFTVNDNASDLQIGTITYKFILSR